MAPSRFCEYTPVVQAIQKRYRDKVFTVLRSSKQLFQSLLPAFRKLQDAVGTPVWLVFRMERFTACEISGMVCKRMPQSGSFISSMRSKSLKHMCEQYRRWQSTSQSQRADTSAAACAAYTSCDPSTCHKLDGWILQKMPPFLLQRLSFVVFQEQTIALNFNGIL